ncbi:hypothetical protein [Streptomyces sp. NPDC053427]|uniref:hypothetical protein n=1 Tax=Streptomyces sp. NPDC053427 TaxID=3365701 RepID=UPI0037CE0BB6
MTPLGTMTPAAELTTTHGIIPGGDPFALTATGPMTATLGMGRAVIQGNPVQGAYPVAVTAPETLTFADGDPANPRIDLVVLRIYDAAHDDSGEVRGHRRDHPRPPGGGGITPYSVADAHRGQYRDIGTGLQRYGSAAWVGIAAELVP